MSSFGRTSIIISIVIVIAGSMYYYFQPTYERTQPENFSVIEEPEEIKQVKTVIASRTDFEDKPREPERKTYTIQVASFRNLERAERFIDSSHSQGYQGSYIFEENSQGNDRWYKIYVGNYQTYEEASSRLIFLRGEFKDSFIRFLQEN